MISRLLCYTCVYINHALATVTEKTLHMTVFNQSYEQTPGYKLDNPMEG